MNESNSKSSIFGTKPSDRRHVVLQTHRECNMSGRNDLLSNPIDQEHVQGNEELLASSECVTDIDENVMIPNEATIQDPPLLRQSQRFIIKPSRYMFVRESKHVISTEQVDYLNSYKKALDDVDTDLWKL
ncbi:Uncharacterized protein Adt_41615 [Abeliophyllum distichum]|uniref:Uncharacterized protein n=1 Tax=Abeliophyllum distichum TaxID=126358 RepID=A0ABD1PQ49_9LAMI